MKYKLTLILENQPEGGFTVTCKELPQLITEGDSIGEAIENAIDAFFAVKALYEYKKKRLPRSVTKHTIKKQYNSTRPQIQLKTNFLRPYEI